MRSLLLLAIALPLLTACASGAEPPPQRIQTTSDANKDGLSGAASAPLRDMNVLRTKIPPTLLEAMADPYARPPGKKISCDTLIMLVAPLDLALGEDVDRHPPEENEDLMDRGKRMAGSAAFGAMASAAQDLIPMRGWVRKLSGAEKHDRLVQSAIASGAIRRAYLKGLGESRGCNPPATPQHLAKPAAPVVEKRFPWMKDAPVADTPVVDAPAVDTPPAQPVPPPAKKTKKPFYKVW
uniref:Lipoprotein n=1 Tax=Caulobacter sp. (strain K31) TaxID=366602 RepID=B0T8H7_CAUSK